jgi:hypothetical protein
MSNERLLKYILNCRPRGKIYKSVDHINLNERDNLGDLGVDGIILKWIFTLSDPSHEEEVSFVGCWFSEHYKYGMCINESKFLSYPLFLFFSYNTIFLFFLSLFCSSFPSSFLSTSSSSSPFHVFLQCPDLHNSEFRA